MGERISLPSAENLLGGGRGGESPVVLCPGSYTYVITNDRKTDVVVVTQQQTGIKDRGGDQDRD